MLPRNLQLFPFSFSPNICIRVSPCSCQNKVSTTDKAAWAAGGSGAGRGAGWDGASCGQTAFAGGKCRVGSRHWPDASRRNASLVRVPNPKDGIREVGAAPQNADSLGEQSCWEKGPAGKSQRLILPAESQPLCPKLSISSRKSGAEHPLAAGNADRRAAVAGNGNPGLHPELQLPVALPGNKLRNAVGVTARARGVQASALPENVA